MVKRRRELIAKVTLEVRDKENNISYHGRPKQTDIRSGTNSLEMVEGQRIKIDNDQKVIQ